MTYLGLATGLRPSSMRPLRRTGPTPDVLWDQGVILIRRSHTLGDEFMKTTKTGLRQRITAPSEVMDVLRWHLDTQLTTPEQKASELLFPAEDGGFRSEAFLKKAFARTAHLIGLNKRFTPRGMRRTFNDLMRQAKVEAIVTRSISGHQTERMREHYSTVTPEEQRRGGPFAYFTQAGQAALDRGCLMIAASGNNIRSWLRGPHRLAIQLADDNGRRSGGRAHSDGDVPQRRARSTLPVPA
jgi:hypothetical protein